MVMQPQFYLASGSPRRRALLEQIGACFEVLDIAVDEAGRAGEAPQDLACRLALAKASAGWMQVSNRGIPVLGADTLVVLNSEVLGKPRDSIDSAEMLRRLSGHSHQVLSAAALVRGAQHRVLLSRTEVTFRKLTIAEREAYVASGEGADKAGGYAIQGLGALFVQQLAGSYSGVMGLPLYECAALLAEFDCLPHWLAPPHPKQPGLNSGLAGA